MAARRGSWAAHGFVRRVRIDFRRNQDARSDRGQHPSIVAIYDIGRLGDGPPFIAMKLVHGHTLAALLAGRRDPSDERPRWLSAFGQVCQAIAFAHSQGVIHRDLKPGNVMVGAFGEVQVMDWGLAKGLSDETGPSEHVVPQYASRHITAITLPGSSSSLPTLLTGKYGMDASRSSGPSKQIITPTLPA